MEEYRFDSGLRHDFYLPTTAFRPALLSTEFRGRGCYPRNEASVEIKNCLMYIYNLALVFMF